ncbi:hypothetical protein TanjilG_00191 [Lupinus angustifolius]|uniref:SHSP domain-containing protein n=1 Tax=Lupinus angustifolius TaxID=3871 RepID=A0A394D0N1_LUPAN|nr:hypothetical protein TanjilG_00191 [Lupinus angustifolius]
MDFRVMDLNTPFYNTLHNMFDLTDETPLNKNLSFDENVLLICVERKREEENDGVKYLRMERRVGKFMRKFVLPENANSNAVSAVCQDGVLSVTVQKLPPPHPKKPKTIGVKVA